MNTSRTERSESGGDDFTNWQYPHSIAEVEPRYRRKGTHHNRRKISSPEDAYSAFTAVWNSNTIECLESGYALYLDGANTVNGFAVIGMGSMTQCSICIQKTITLGLVTSSASFLIAHNHPSGRLEPSGDDRSLTRRLYRAARLVGLTLLDHLIVVSKDDDDDDERAFHSLKNSHPLLFECNTDSLTHSA